MLTVRVTVKVRIRVRARVGVRVINKDHFLQLINVSQIILQATGHLMTAKKISLEGTTEEDSEIFLSSNDDSCNQCWIMDYRTNGTFLIVSETTNHLVLTCDGSLECMKLLMRRFTGDENQLWRFDGNYIESVKFEGYVIGGQSNLALCVKEVGNKMQLYELMVSI